MVKVKKNEVVLVTGGGGYLAGWIIRALLQRGYYVRTTVRDLRKEAGIRTMLQATGTLQTGDLEKLSFFQASLENKLGWTEAVEGCTYVIHTASPFPSVQPKDENDIIAPARDGTLHVLRACLQANVQHVVLTSSAAAVEYTATPVTGPVTENSWTDIARKDITAYAKSKTIAEKAAWDFVAKHPSLSLTTIAPGTMLGPVMGEHLSFSIQSVKQLLDGSAPALPKLGFSFVDVRDVAELHVIAMTQHEKTAGQRLLAGGKFLWLRDISVILQSVGYKNAPSYELPNFLVRMFSVFSPSLRSLVSDLGKTHHYSSEKAKRLIGWKMRPIEQTVVDTAKSLFDHKIIS